MKRNFFCILFLLLSLSFISLLHAYPVRYQASPFKKIPSNLEREITSQLSKKGFELFLIQEPSFYFFRADMIFLHEGSKETIFVKYNLRSNGVPIGKLIKIDNGYIVHLKDTRGVISGIFFRNFSKIKAKHYAKFLNKILQFKEHSNSWKNNIFIKNVLACDEKSLLEESFFRAFLKKAGNVSYACATKLFETFYETLKGQTKYTASIFYRYPKALTEGVQYVWKNGLKMAINDFWNDFIIVPFENLRKLMDNFETITRETSEFFRKAPLEATTKLICQFLGHILSNVLMAYITGGDDFTILLKNFNDYLSSFQLMPPTVLEVLFNTSKNFHIGGLDHIIQLIGLGEIPHSFFKKVIEISESDSYLNMVYFLKCLGSKLPSNAFLLDYEGGERGMSFLSAGPTEVKDTLQTYPSNILKICDNVKKFYNENIKQKQAKAKERKKQKKKKKKKKKRTKRNKR